MRRADTPNDSVAADEGKEKWVRDDLIPVAVDWTNAVPMTVVTASWDNSVCVRPMELEPASVNIGISANGVSLSHKMNMQEGEWFYEPCWRGTTYVIRSSTTDKEGRGDFFIIY